MDIAARIAWRYRIRRWRRAASPDGGLTQTIVVPPSDGRPGERIQAASPSLYAPAVGKDGSRSDFRVVAGPYGGSLAAVCLDRDLNADPERSAVRARSNMIRHGFAVSEISTRVLAGESAVGFRFQTPSLAVTDWHFTHKGWTYVVGVMCEESRHEQVALKAAEDALATWTWLDG